MKSINSLGKSYCSTVPKKGWLCTPSIFALEEFPLVRAAMSAFKRCLGSYAPRLPYYLPLQTRLRALSVEGYVIPTAPVSFTGLSLLLDLTGRAVAFCGQHT